MIERNKFVRSLMQPILRMGQQWVQLMQKLMIDQLYCVVLWWIVLVRTAIPETAVKRAILLCLIICVYIVSQKLRPSSRLENYLRPKPGN